jgi:lipoate-protein ligase A
VDAFMSGGRQRAAEGRLGDVRLLVDPPAAGPWNMAVDEALLATAAERRLPSLRLYQWSPATLSLGYFQQCADRQSHAASLETAVVRRASGGGAIVHDCELTYSLALPTVHPLAANPERLYGAIHTALIDTLGHLGIEAKLRCDGSSLPPDKEPFLCFQRRADGDVLVAGQKVCGSAQRRSRGAILQHGSVLLGASPFAPELLGIAELSGHPLTAEGPGERWLAELSRSLGAKWSAGTLSSLEADLADRLAEERYGSLAWTRRR